MKARGRDGRRAPGKLWRAAKTRVRSGMGSAAARTRSVSDAISKLRRKRRAAKARAATKTAIIRFMQSAGGHSASVAVTSRASIAWALHLTAEELQPFLDELIIERRIFRCLPPLPSGHYALERWNPDREKLT